MSRHLQPMIMCFLHHRMHLVESHAQRVMIVCVGGRGIAGGIGLDPFDPVLHKLAHCAPPFLGAVDQQNEPFHADLAEIGIPVHQSSDAADFTPTGRKPGGRA